MTPTPKRHAPKDTADPAWQQATRDVAPLRRRSTPRRARRAEPSSWDISSPAAARHFSSTPLEVLAHEVGRTAGLAPHHDRQLLKDLAAGRYRPEAMLDLHGATAAEAFMKLMDWLHRAADNDCRSVLVITGKGHGFGPERKMGLLKWQLPQWLSSHPRVLAFHTAQPADGGSGALYVYLRRRGRTG
jgi:DNA-nicking Smr family endonuclease